MSNQIISFTVLISSNFNSWIWISDTNLRGMVMVGLHDQRTLKCCLTWKTFAFIYWNSIHAKGELIRSALGKKLRKGSRPTRDTSTYNSCDIYSCSRIDRKPTSRRLPFIAFLVNSWRKVPLFHIDSVRTWFFDTFSVTFATKEAAIWRDTICCL